MLASGRPSFPFGALANFPGLQYVKLPRSSRCTYEAPINVQKINGHVGLYLITAINGVICALTYNNWFSWAHLVLFVGL